ncbi:MAG: hypothetical protein AB1Y26_07635 [Cycloclasticus sp.]
MRLAFYKGKSLSSRLIRRKTRGKYSHVGIIFSDGRILEAWFSTNSVRWIDNLSDGHTEGTEVDIFEINGQVDEAAGLKFALKQVGMPYGHMKIIRFMTYTNRGNPFNWICSEIALALVRTAGVSLLARVEAYKVSPSMLSWSPYLIFSETITTTKAGKKIG